jgi:glycosyltransferase involved in cell wall biosynthesis
MKSKKVSIIIPSYMMGRYIGDALESVAAQTYSAWEIIAVDDCAPDDGTERIVQEFAKSHPEHRVEYIRHEINTGVSGARNTALSMAEGEFVAFLDPDDLWLPTYLQASLDALRTNPHWDIVSSPPIKFWVDSGRAIKPESKKFENWQISLFPASLGVSNFIQPSSTIARLGLVKRAGGFDTSPELQHIEDYDLWIRLLEAGGKFGFINKHLSKYRKHPTAATSNDNQMEKLHERLIEKHPRFFIRSQQKMIFHLLQGSIKYKPEKKTYGVHFVKKVLRRLLLKIRPIKS